VETRDLTQDEHDKRVFWAEQNVMQANAKMAGAYVAVVIKEGEKVLRFTGSGEPTDETKALIEELMS
jgi:hypothetical protein